MTIQNPISDLIVRIRNAQLTNKNKVLIPLSKIKLAIIKILYTEGYIINFSIYEKYNNKKYIKLKLKYFNNKPVIEEITQISKPSARIYKSNNKLPIIKNGLGILLISTSQGIMTDKKAKLLGLGGELICSII